MRQAETLHLEKIQYRYPGKSTPALKEISADFIPGLYGLLGPNGAGKSTLIRLLTGSIPLQSGQLRLGERAVTTHSRWFYRQLGYAPQQPCFYPEFTGRQMLSYFCDLKQIPSKVKKIEIERCSALFDMRQYLDTRMGAYSGGMRQRLLLAQAFLGEPHLLILDEPSSGLDLRQQVCLRRVVQQAAAAGHIVLVSTHVVSDLENADHVLLLRNGELIAQGAVETLCAEFACENLEQVYLHVMGEAVP